MSIQYTSTKSVAYKNTPAQISTPTATDYTPWIRPADWLTLPTVSTTDQKFVGLLAITNDDSNMIALTCTTSAGQWFVDWGDGTSQTVGSNAPGNKLYDYNTISDTTISTLGYKQVIVTITPVSGNLTNVNINKKYPQSSANMINSGTVNAYASKWLDITFGSPFLNQGLFQIDNNGTTTCNWLEQITMQSCSSAASMVYGFWGLRKLRKVNFTSSVAPNNLTGMFKACTALQQCDLINCVNAGLSYLDSVFQDCVNLKVCGFYNSSGVISLVNTFNGCRSLITAPIFDTTNVRNTSGMFQNCVSLQKVPTYQFGNLSNTSSMFSGCIALRVIPPINTSKVSNMNATFNICSVLETIPLLDTSNVTDMSVMFNGCVNLQNLPMLNTSKATNMYTMFQSCRSLRTVPLFNTSNVANMAVMFSNTNSLMTIPLLDTSNVTNMTSMFQNADALYTVPLFNTIKVTNMTYMFSQATGLITIPLFDTSNVTDMNSMFINCTSLAEVPLLNTVKVTNMTSMFSGCQALTKVPLLNTANGITFSGMFNSCYSLVEVPAFVISNTATGVSSMLTNNNNLSSIKIPYVPKRSMDVNTCRLSANALQAWFGNLASGNSTASSTNISSNYGAGTVYARTGNTVQASKTIVMANTVGLISGMYVIGNNVNISPSRTHNSAQILTDSPPTDGTPIAFSAFTNVTNLALHTIYYVVNSFPASGYFQVALTPDGSFVNFNDTTTSGTITYKFPNQIATVNANANIVMTQFSQATTTTVSLSGRWLNTNAAVMKNWTISG